jgi:AcrR family transcriptional regulator
MAADADNLDGRRARSQRTSSRVLAVARELFLEHGYARTSMEAIATRAGITAQTVYNQFGTKGELLRAVLDRAIAGDAAAATVIERPEFAIDAIEPAADAIARFATVGTTLLARAAPLYDVMRSASSLPEVRQLLHDNRRRRRADQRHVVRALVATGQLRPDIDADRAADVVYALANEDVFLLLTADCGWSRKRFATWLGSTLHGQLMPAT